MKKEKCANKHNHHTDIEEDCPGIESNGQSLETEETFCYLDNTIRARGAAANNAITRMRIGWTIFRSYSVY